MQYIELVFQKPNKELFYARYPYLENMTVSDVLKASACYSDFPELQGRPVGVFGKIVALETQLIAGDRVEIYAPLLIDPKQARRQRAKPKK
jgi:putative ubiquitin-RnfH superfamily antitoxin RatB of RatAB toxin-antitoxin module